MDLPSGDVGECPSCTERFNTFETAELKLPSIVKSDGRREAFDEKKLRTSFDRPLQKRPISAEQVDQAVRNVMHSLRLSGERELPSMRVGEFVMNELKSLDHVAYVRFASVYRSFEDVQEFREEIEKLERDFTGLDKAQLSLLGANVSKAQGKP